MAAAIVGMRHEGGGGDGGPAAAVLGLMGDQAPGGGESASAAGPTRGRWLKSANEDDLNMK